MIKAVDSIIEILDLNTRLFRNCLKGADDRAIRARVTGSTNSLHFLGCHLVETRYYMSTMIGFEEATPFPELADVRTIDEMPEPGPSLDAILNAWDHISPLLGNRLRSLDENVLERDSPVSFPSRSETVFGALSFLAQHESYHIGQMALLRKALGFEAMSYR